MSNKSNKSNILSSLTSLLKDLGNSSRNVLISIGSDSSLSNLNFYENLLSRVSNKFPSVLIFFCELSDFPFSIREKFTGKTYLKYRDDSKDKFKDDIFSIYLIPHNLPILTDIERESFSNLSDPLFFLTSSRVSISNIGSQLKFVYRGVEMPYNRIDLNFCIESFLSREFMILLTQYCLSMIRFGGDIFLLNRWSLDTRGWFGNGESNPLSIRVTGNKYLDKIPYFYPFISLLKDSQKFSIMIERDESNYLSKFVDSINMVSSPPFFDDNLDYLKRDWKEMIVSSAENVSSFESIELSRNILTSDGSSIIQIPSDSFSTAFGNEWLNSYAVIVGLNNVLNRFSIVDLDKIVVCIPEIQYEILQNRWNVIRNSRLLRDCKLLFIPINISGIHWTLLMINFELGIGYHIDSLPIDKKEEYKYEDKKYENKKYEDKKYEDEKYENKKYEKSKYEDKKYDNLSNYEICNTICNKILNRDVINIHLDDQKNGYDCGAFILLHLYYLINGSINDYNILNYLEDKTRGVDIKIDIKKIREDIYKFGDISLSSYDDKKVSKKKKSGKRSKLKRDSRKRNNKIKKRSLKRRRKSLKSLKK